MSEHKREVLRLCHEYLMPNRVETWLGAGIPLVIGRREGYRIWDVDGHELYDVHLNGGTYNLGHRNPEVLAALQEALEWLDIGNHHFPSEARARLAQQLAEHTPGSLHYTVFVASGSEANDLAIKSARHATGMPRAGARWCRSTRASTAPRGSPARLATPTRHGSSIAPTPRSS
jgi:4-aminobutyrate aminotransferase-like enzyme